MARPSRYSPEVRERSVRLVLEQSDKHASQWAAIESISANRTETFVMLTLSVRHHDRISDAQA